MSNTTIEKPKIIFPKIKEALFEDSDLNVRCDCFYDKEKGIYFAVPNPNGGWLFKLDEQSIPNNI